MAEIMTIEPGHLILTAVARAEPLFSDTPLK
jgi:hypothetical protein